MCAVVVDRRSAEAPVRNLSKASVKFLAALGPHAKLPAEMSIFPTLGARVSDRYSAPDGGACPGGGPRSGWLGRQPLPEALISAPQAKKFWR